MTTRHTALTKTTLLLASSLTVMAGATIAPALPALQAHFAGVPNAGLLVRLVLTLPALPIVLGAPLAGLIADRGGRTRLLLASMLLYAVAGSSGLYLDSLAAILIGRALLGAAVAGVMTSATALVADYFTGAERARFMGWQAAFMNLGGVVFLTGGGALAELGWRFPFLIYLVALPLALLARYALPEPARDDDDAATGAPNRTSGGTAPLRALAPIYALATCGMIAFYLIPSQLPFHLESLVGAGPTASGAAIAVATCAGMMTSLAYGRIRARLGFTSILALNLVLMAVGYLVIWRAQSYVPVLAGLAVGGLGMGLLMPNLNLWVTTLAPAALRGRALGGLATAIFLGQFLSPLVSEPVARAVGLATTFGTTGLLLLLGAGLLLMVGRPGATRESPPAATRSLAA